MTNSFDLTGNTAIVTGANTGLGQAIAVGARQGRRRHRRGRPLGRWTRRSASAARPAPASMAIRADLATLEPIERIVCESADIGGRIDILVNNAGIIRRADATSTSPSRTGTT